RGRAAAARGGAAQPRFRALAGGGPGTGWRRAGGEAPRRRARPPRRPALAAAAERPRAGRGDELRRRGAPAAGAAASAAAARDAAAAGAAGPHPAVDRAPPLRGPRAGGDGRPALGARHLILPSISPCSRDRPPARVGLHL